MKLSNMDCSAWEELEQKGYATPKYNRQEMIKNTKENPFWIHFGAGNIFRAFPVNVVEQLLNEGKLDRGFIVAEGYDYEIIEKAYQKYDNYSILVTLHGDGTLDKAVLGSVAESLEMNREKEADFERLKAIFKNPSLQIVSFTITEKGYQISDKDGNYFEAIKKDIELGPDKAQSYMGKLAALLVERYENGAVPVALVSMDNCSKNGEKLRNAVTSIAKEWVNHKKVEEGFLAYVENENCVAFPWTMIDKITPRPSEVIEKMLTEDGWEEASATVTGKNTYVAPFVNAEECQYLVIEDSFPNGRPDITGKGIFFTDRETVNRSEQMKVCTCLNPIHTALAIFGCLLEIETMSGAIKNPELKALAEEIGYQE